MTVVQSDIFLLLLTLCQLARCGVIHCDEQLKPSCSNSKRLHCVDDEDCYIYCTGSNACDYMHLICPFGPYNCTLICDGSDNSASFGGCYQTIINASNTIGGNLIIHAKNKEKIMSHSKIYCPSNGDCNITLINSDMALGNNAEIHGESSNVLYLTISGGSDMLSNGTDVYCPETILPSSEYKCFIHATAVENNYNIIGAVNIYATHGLNDVDLYCNDNLGPYHSCIVGTNYNETAVDAQILPKIYCMYNYLTSSSITMIYDGNYTNWIYVMNGDDMSECNNYEEFESTMNTLVFISSTLETQVYDFDLTKDPIWEAFCGVLAIMIIATLLFVGRFYCKRKVENRDDVAINIQTLDEELHEFQAITEARK